ncbi:hypothetical protein [Methylobacterium sp. WSM2598]|uniref:hypothetical protein n=1 Tax=Methylobacterium sp. WSM2598 TaxID=398261 RepID=UPI000365CF54|nr:hypothetical protein [Methylobacterium sp. WSM2598]
MTDLAAIPLADVEAVGAGLRITTAGGTATVSLGAEAGAVVLAVAAPRLGEDWRLPLWAVEHLAQQCARARAEAAEMAAGCAALPAGALTDP